MSCCSVSIDLKGGIGLRPMAPLIVWLANEAVAMLEALVRIIDARSAYAASRGWKVWQPSREYPVILVMIDETARLTGFQALPQIRSRALAAITQAATLGAGAGVLLDPATQYPGIEALGSMQFCENLAYTECFRLRSPGSGSQFLPNAPAGVDPASIPAERKGTCYIDAQGEFRPLPALKPDVTDTQMRATVARWWDTTPSSTQFPPPRPGRCTPRARGGF
jgi:hypothetical protein